MSRPLYPLFLDVSGRTCLVVGGGAVATERAAKLADAGARVRAVAPAATGRLRGLAAEWRARPYEPGDLDGCVLAVAATDAPEVNRRVAEDARAAGVPVNVADDPDRGTFVVPALVRRGDLALAVTTGGASPVVARRVREDLEARFGPEWAGLLRLLAERREALKARHPDIAGRRAAVERLLDGGVLDLLAAGDLDGARRRADADLGLGAPAARVA